MGLLALKRCISALNSNDADHVPFGDATLTALLRPALSGNSFTTIVVTGSLESRHAYETLQVRPHVCVCVCVCVWRGRERECVCVCGERECVCLWRESVYEDCFWVFVLLMGLVLHVLVLPFASRFSAQHTHTHTEQLTHFFFFFCCCVVGARRCALERPVRL